MARLIIVVFAALILSGCFLANPVPLDRDGAALWQRIYTECTIPNHDPPDPRTDKCMQAKFERAKAGLSL